MSILRRKACSAADRARRASARAAPSWLGGPGGERHRLVGQPLHGRRRRTESADPADGADGSRQAGGELPSAVLIESAISVTDAASRCDGRVSSGGISVFSR